MPKTSFYIVWFDTDNMQSFEVMSASEFTYVGGYGVFPNSDAIMALDRSDAYSRVRSGGVRGSGNNGGPIQPARFR